MTVTDDRDAKTSGNRNAGIVDQRVFTVVRCYGYTDEYPISRFYRDARIQTIYGRHVRNHERSDRARHF